MTITLPDITIPPGCEGQAAQLLRGLNQFFQFTARPDVISDPAMRSVTTSLEHALNEGAKEAEAAARKPFLPS